MMRRFFRRGAKAAATFPELRQAHLLMDQGNYEGAAQAFEDLAAAGGRRAPILYLKAGHAHILAGQASQAVTDLQNGLGMLAARGRWSRYQRAGQRAVAELRREGMETQADTLLEFLKTNSLSGSFDPSVPSTLKRRPLLPAHCPSCGAVLEPDEVEWLDETTVECDYCGTPIHAQAGGKA